MPPTGPERPSSPSLSQIDVLGPGKLERHLVDVLPGHGLAFASGDDQGSLVYELRIPLRKTDQHPYAVSAAPGGLIALQIASPELGPGGRGGRPGERGGFRGGVGGGGRGGQMGGGGGRGGSGAPMPGRGGPDEPSARPKPVKLWFKLQLVRTPA